MNLVCSSGGIIGYLRPGNNIKDILSSGFTEASFDMNALVNPGEFQVISRKNFKREGSRIYLTEHPEELVSEAEKRFLSHAKNQGLEMPVAVAPFPFPNTNMGKDPEETARKLNSLYKKLSEEALKAAIKAGCKRIIVHPLFAGIRSGQEWDYNKCFYLELAAIATDLGSDIRILLINQLKDINGHFVRGICAEPEEACSWVDRLNDESKAAGHQLKDASNGGHRFAFCYDIGVGTIAGQNLYSAVTPLGERLEAVIVRDCDGIHNVSMMPYSACIMGQQTDWLEFVRALRYVDFDGDLIMDFGDTYSCCPDTLRKGVIERGYRVGKYFLWQLGIEQVIRKYDKRVLFGAGNMCRTYIKNYGEKYPPLFTCDNNESRWGEEFCGLTIESPEKLKELSPDTAIFICNMYYSEITEQLKEMNLPNPIEWFSDEYMPTFFMDRLEMAADPRKGKGDAK